MQSYATGLREERKSVNLFAKQGQIHWTQKMIAGVKELKKGSCDMVMREDTGSVLPQPDGQWLMRCDASYFAVGGVPEQMQLDGSWHPVGFYSQKVQVERAGTSKEGFTRTKHTGQYGWTLRKREAYEIVSCLLKFQSWIGGKGNNHQD